MTIPTPGLVPRRGSGARLERAHRPAGPALTSFGPGDDRLRVALGLTLEIDRLTLDNSSVCRGHGELGKSFREENHGRHFRDGLG